MIGTIPSSSVAMAVKAPTERSIELEDTQVGQSSTIVTVTLFWFLVFVIFTCFPQRSDFSPESP